MGISTKKEKITKKFLETEMFSKMEKVVIAVSSYHISQALWLERGREPLGNSRENLKQMYINLSHLPEI